MVVDPEKIVAHLIHDTIGTSRYEFPVSEIVGGFGRRWHDPKGTQLMNQTWLCTGKIVRYLYLVHVTCTILQEIVFTYIDMNTLLKYDCTGTRVL